MTSPRALLATEGPSEDAIATELLKHLCPAMHIDPKILPARGFQVVRRSVPTLARAAYHGFYDLLVVHFDLDETISNLENEASITNSPRWREINDKIHEELNSLPDIGRTRAVRVVLMAPCQSTEAWLQWGYIGGDGKRFETADREELKSKLYGDPPRGLETKSLRHALVLTQRLKNSDDLPVSLRLFIGQVANATR